MPDSSLEDVLSEDEKAANRAMFDQRVDSEISRIGNRYRDGLESLEKAHPHLTKKIALARTWAQDFDPSAETETRGLYIHGPIGTGKTGIALGIAILLIRRGISVQSSNVPALLATIKSTFGNSDADETQSEIEYYARTASVLILDDIGAERQSDWTLDTLCRIVNGRYEDMLPIIATSNLTLKELTGRGGSLSSQRIGSRFCDMMSEMSMPTRHLRGA